MNTTDSKNQKKGASSQKTDKINTKKESVALDNRGLNRLLAGVIAISIIVGGIAGLLMGTWAITDSRVSSWVQKNVFGQSYAQTTNSNTDAISGSKNITIEENSETITAVEKVSHSVVSIIVTQDLSEIYNNSGLGTSPFGNLFDLPFRFDVPEGEQQVGAGTGFIITSDGLIVTNKHVVNTDGAKYTVILASGEEYEAKVLDSDPYNDIALIKIEAKDLPIVTLGDSDALKIGQTVIAIGNTLGEYTNTVTRGIVSGLSRTITAGDAQGQSETLENIIQTDAAINFGNSGGPLINLAGQVIGVNTAISQEGQLVGFAIPINQAKKAIESVKQNGEIIRPYLGVRYLLINEQIAETNNLSVDYGALIVRGSSAAELAVIPGSPADKAGLVENDIILEINGETITQDRSLARELQKYNPGDTVTMKVLHDDQEKEVSATLAKAED